MPFPSKEAGLKDYLKILRKRRALVGVFALFVLGVVALITLTTTPLYEGTTKVLLERVQPSNLTGRLQDNNTDPGFFQTQLQLIKSRAVARRVIDLLSIDPNDENLLWLEQDFLDREGSISFLSSALGLGNDAGQDRLTREERIADSLSRQIQVRLMPDTRIVTISFKSPNPNFSSLVANTTARAYIEETLDMKMESTRRTLEWMTKKADEERQRLETAERALQEYSRANNIVTLENRVAGTPEEFSEISTQLVRAESSRKQLEALNTMVRQVVAGTQPPETISTIAADSALQALRAQIVQAEKNIMELSGKYGAKHPVMEKAASDLRILEQKREQEIQRIIGSIQNEYQLAQANENNLRSKLESIKGEAMRLNDKFVQYGVLKREVDTNRQIYDALMLKIKEQSITEENKPIDLWIVEEAQVPGRASSPLVGLNLLIGLGLGLAGGAVLALFAEYLDNTLKNPEEAESALGYPVLGIVSKATNKAMDCIVLKEPQSVLAENYKGLRTSLLLSCAEQAPRSILVTSSVSGEGKTTTAVNLALTLAQSDKRVALIDADMRKPRVHRIFRLGNQEGLSSVLAGVADGDVLKRGPMPNLTVMTAGPIPPNPSELLMSERMRQLVSSLLGRFDYVICDSPPVLAVDDPRILSRLFDGTVLVAQAHKTTYETTGRAIRSLKEVNTPVLGLVMNGLDLRKSGGGYQYYYQSYREEAATVAAESR